MVRKPATKEEKKTIEEEEIQDTVSSLWLLLNEYYCWITGFTNQLQSLISIISSISNQEASKLATQIEKRGRLKSVTIWDKVLYIEFTAGRTTFLSRDLNKIPFLKEVTALATNSLEESAYSINYFTQKIKEIKVREINDKSCLTHNGFEAEEKTKRKKFKESLEDAKEEYRGQCSNYDNYVSDEEKWQYSGYGCTSIIERSINYEEACEMFELSRRGFTMKELKKARNRLALEYHPDVCKNEDTSATMVMINEAYELLERYCA